VLVRLIPDQISKFWDVIKYALENSPPLTTDISWDSWINEILTSAMSGGIEVWASYSKVKEFKFEGVALTSFEIDKFIKKKSLLIYYIFTYQEAAKSSWINGLKTLAKYAESRGCHRIIAYSNIPEIIKMCDALGGDTSIRFITFNIGDLI